MTDCRIAHAQLAVFLLLTAVGCGAGRQDNYEPGALISSAQVAPAASAQQTPVTSEAELAKATRLDAILMLALARNPQLAEARERIHAAAARSNAVGRLPDLELKYEQWHVPLQRPWDLGKANMLMVGVRQSLPAPGVLKARTHAAQEDTRASAAGLRMRSLDLVREAQDAFFAYYGADREAAVLQELTQLARQIVELAQANYRVGRASQQDVMRARLELSRLSTEVVRVKQERRSAQARINTLIARPEDALLGPPVEIALDSADDAVGTASAAEERRPEIESGRRGVARSEAALQEARAAANWPGLTLGIDYMYVPQADMRHGYGAMVALTLPWLNPRYRAEVRNAERSQAAEAQALESMRLQVRYELADARARYQAARETLRILDNDLLPEARQNYDAAQAAFTSGQGDGLALLDALRSYLSVRIEQVRARARVGSTLAGLERAAGRVPASIAQPAR